MLANELSEPEGSGESPDRIAGLGTGAALQSRAAALIALGAQQAAQARQAQQLDELNRLDQLELPVAGADAAVRTDTWRSGWIALTLAMLARSVLTMVASLLLWSVAPLLLGWHPTVVMTGSMEPRLHPGDVVVSRPVPVSKLAVGQIVLATDPDHPDRLRLHRLAVMNADGSLTLRGDANSANDSTPVRRSAVHGVASLRIPYLGRAELLRQQHNELGLALVVLGLAGLVGLARLYRPVDDNADTADDSASDDSASDDSASNDSAGSDDSGSDDRAQELTHQDVSAGPAPRRAGTPGSHRAPDTGRSGSGLTVVRRLAAFALLLLTVGSLTVVTAGRASAATRFGGTASNAGNNWAAVPYFTCKSAVLAASPYFYYQFGETTGTTAADSSGNGRPGTYQGTRPTAGVSGSCARDNSTAVTLNGSSSYISTPTSVVNPSVFTSEIWFKTTTTSGGELIGLANTQTGSPGVYDRHLYLTNSGQVVFGVYPNAVKTVTSPKAYNDGGWHLADAVLSSAGMQLYLDGQLVAADATVTTAQNYTGYWRIGDNNLAGWTSAPTSYFLNATIDDAAVYTSALTAAQISAHYTAA